MAYIGNVPADKYTTFDKQTITGDGGTGYTLDHAVANAQEIEVFVNNVRQEPGVAYTVSGTTLTMTGNVASTDDFYVVYQGKAIQTTTHPEGQSLQAVDGTFSGDVSAVDGTFSGNVSAVDGTFSGNASITGTLGVGVSSPQEHLSIDVALNDTEGLGLEYNGETKGGIKLYPSGGEVRVGSLNSTGTYNTTIYSNNSERMRVDSTGSVLLGTTTWPGSTNNGGAVFRKTSVGRMELGLANTDSSTRTMVNFFANSSTTSVGTIKINSTSTTYNTSSDHRLKENVVDMTGAIDRVKQLSPCRFNWIASPDTTVDGFLAHEAQAVVPEAVSGTHNGLEVWEEDEDLPDGVSVGDNKLDEDGNTIPDYQQIDQSKLVPLLTGALQEAIAKIETLEAKVAVLESN